MNKARENFKEYSNDATLFVNAQLRYFYSILDFGDALFKSSTDVNRSEFENFYRKLVLKENVGVDTINLISYIQKVDHKQEFEKKVKTEQTNPPLLNYSFSIYPSGDRPEYWIINYLVPSAPNRKYFGYDILSDPEFVSYFKEAAQADVIVATDRKVFVDKEQLLLIKPVYTNNMQIRTIEERMAALNGFVVLFLNPDNIFTNTAEYLKENFNVNLKVGFGHVQMDQIKAAVPFYENSHPTPLLSDDTENDWVEASYSKLADKEITVITDTAIREQLGLFEGVISDVIFAVSSLITLIFFLLVVDINNQTSEENVKHTVE
ncbi:MAG: CHASE domain-containing protein [Patescibacteria group bacterium]|jgi:CHASE1-domain containing sensor protein